MDLFSRFGFMDEGPDPDDPEYHLLPLEFTGTNYVIGDQQGFPAAFPQYGSVAPPYSAALKSRTLSVRWEDSTLPRTMRFRALSASSWSASHR